MIWHIDDCVYWIMYRARSISYCWSGVSDRVRHPGALGEWWYIHYVEHISFDLLFFVSTSICMLLMFMLWLWISDEGQSLCVIMYPHLLSIDLLCDRWVNQYHAHCRLNHVSLIELSIEIFYEHLIWSCIILDPFIMYVSIFEIG